MSRYSRNQEREEEVQDLVGQGGRPVAALSLRRLLAEARPEAWLITGGTVCLFLSALANLAIPALFGRIIDALTASSDVDVRKAELAQSVIYLCIVTVIGNVFTFCRAFCFNYSGERVVARLRVRLFQAIMAQEIGFFDATRTGNLISRLGSDTSVLCNAVTSNVSMALRWGATVIGGVIYLFALSWKLTAVLMGVVPVVVGVTALYGRFVRKISKESRAALAEAAEVAEESISSIRTVRSFGREPKRQGLYDIKIAHTLELGRRLSLANGGFSAALGFATLAFIAIVFYGGNLVIAGEMSSGTLTSYLLYAITIAAAMGGLGSVFGDMMQAVGANDRVFQILDRIPAIPLTNGQGSGYLAMKGHVSFQNVNFAYPTRPDALVLTNMDLDLPPGKVVALVGSSGGGKSTVVSLIERFYDVSSGAVLIDGQDIRQLDASWVRRQIGLVGQEPVLFAGTIRENIAFGVDVVTDAEIEAAAVKANAHQFIMTFPNGYDTLVGERGVRLSGGQKQRVAIARALLMNPSILLLDEATSALDAESEHLVQEALERLMKDRTTLIIAHRLSTVISADTVVVISGGRVCGKGTHQELLANNEMYANLVRRQLAATESPLPSSTSPTSPSPSPAAGGSGAGAADVLLGFTDRSIQ